MNRKLWKTVTVLGLALSTPFFAFARGGGGGGGGHGGGGGGHGGGGGGGHGGGGGGHVGGGGGGGGQGGGGGRVGGGGGGGGPRVGGGGGGAPHIGGGQPAHNIGGGGGIRPGGQVGNPGGGRPAFSQPNLGAHPGIQQGHNLGGVRNNFQPGGSNFRPGNQAHGNGGHPGFNPGGQNGINRQFGGAGQRPGLNQSNFNRANVNGLNRNTSFNRNNYAGNNLNYGNRSYNFANNGYRPSYYNHPGTYQGSWNGNRFGGYGGGYGTGYRGIGAGFGPGGYGGYGGYRGYGGYGGWGLGYGYRPLGWGLAGWGLGSLLYNSGYLGYSNPYYASGYGGGGGSYGTNYSYAQPIPVAYNVDTSSAVADVSGQSADDILNTAIASFKQNDYDTALSTINTGVSKFPSDSVMHEFRALVLFANGDYPQSAATMHSVLAVGPGWNWTTLSSLYTDVAVYTTQLRSLEAAVKNRPEDGAQRFLLAYHYMSDGYPDSAAKQLQEVVRLVPNDKVANDLLKMVSVPQATNSVDQQTPVAGQTIGQPIPEPPAGPTANPAAGIPSPTNPDAKPIDPMAIVGEWKATREDGSNFSLKLSNDKTFTWNFAAKEQSSQSFDGTYSIDGNVLALERKGGGSMLAEIVVNDAGHFTFKPVGAPPEDPGLSFSK